MKFLCANRQYDLTEVLSHRDEVDVLLWPVGHGCYTLQGHGSFCGWGQQLPQKWVCSGAHTGERAVLFIGMAMNHVQEDLLSKIGSRIFLCHQQDGDPATTWQAQMVSSVKKGYLGKLHEIEFQRQNVFLWSLLWLTGLLCSNLKTGWGFVCMVGMRMDSCKVAKQPRPNFQHKFPANLKCVFMVCSGRLYITTK